MSLLDNILGAGASYAFLDDTINTARNLPNQLQQAASSIAGDVGQAAQFKPFTVTGPSGNIGFTNQGVNLGGPTSQAQGLMGQAQQQINALGQPVAGLGNLGATAFGQAQQALNTQSGQPLANFGATLAQQGQQQATGFTNAGLGGLQTALTNQAMQQGPNTGFAQTVQQQAAQGIPFAGMFNNVSDTFGNMSPSQFTNIAGQVSQNALANTNFGQQAPNVTGAFSGIQVPNVRSGSGEFGGNLLNQAQGMLGESTPTASSLFDQIRSMQNPEEERQRIALENRLAAQGRLGVNTAAYGGTPEQLAMEKAQAEARNSAAFQATQMADQLASSQQQRAAQLGQLGLSGEQIQAQLDAEGFGQQMQLGQSSLQEAQTQEQLQSSVQQRQTQLAQLGLSADQIRNQLEAEGFTQQLQLGQSNLQAQQLQSQLQSEAQNRANQLRQLGLSAEQVEAQLDSEGFNRTAQAAQTAGQLAQTQAQINAQNQQLGQGLLGLGLEAQQRAGDLNVQDSQRAQIASQIGQQVSSLPLALQGAQLQNIVTSLTASGIPLDQAIQQATLGVQAGGMLQTGGQLQAQAMADLGRQTLAGIPAATNAEAMLRQAQLQAITDSLLGSQGAASGLLSTAIGQGGDFLDDVLGLDPNGNGLFSLFNQ